MTSILESVASNLAQRLVEKTIQEVRYFRDFEDHIHNFVIENNSLVAKRNKVQKDIEDAQHNVNQIEDDVQNWIDEANIVIQHNTDIKQTWSYGWCPYWRYRQAKRLSKRTLAIRDHMEKWNFDILAHPIELPSIKYHALSKDFIDFEGRKKKFKELVEALKDGNHHMIGLQGMGGTGKTTLATQVGKQLEESKAFEKVIFIVVSNPPDVTKIRCDIARQLGLKLEERDEVDHSTLLWHRISENENKLLIILDDVWGELNLRNIGIPSGIAHKNCYVLVTTRHSKVCQAMQCQQIVRLHTLGEEDALNLFLFHARSNDDSSSNELEGLARDFSKECGGLPVAIVALASALKNLHVGELNAALTALRKSKSLREVDEDLVEVYSCLRLSYDNLHNEKAQKLFLLCSIFPEDYEFSINLIIRLGIGSGIYEEVDEYYAARTRALQLKKKLTDSSLLLRVEEKECVRMHDLIREVAHQWIAKEDIQIIMDARTTLKANRRFVFWSSDDFPDPVDGTKLEMLLLWISGNVPIKDASTFFAGMPRLKILFLHGEYDRKVPSLSFSQSLRSLNNIQTLILDGWKIGDISVVKNLQSLVTLEFKNCLINELPRDIMELNKLRWLGLRKCEIQKNNPFEVIERCSQLEELYFVENYNVEHWMTKDNKEIEGEIALDISPALEMFSISYNDFKCFANNYSGLLKCFNPEHIIHLMSEAMFKYLVGRAEIIELGEIEQTRWKSLVPDIIPMQDAGMDNLKQLYLYKGADIECLIDTTSFHHSNITVFSKLVELHLYGVNVKKLYCGAMPSNLLKQLQVLQLKDCMELQNIFLDENLKLPQLKVLKLISCPMFQPSIFQPSVARSLAQLEKLVISNCNELKSLIAHETLEEELIVVGSQKNYGALFPKLKSLKIIGCGNLEMILSLLPGNLPMLKELYINDCKELKYIFGEYRDVGQILQQEAMLPLLTDMQLYKVPNFINIFQKCKKCMPRPPQLLKEKSMEKCEISKISDFSWTLGCCFMAPSKDINIRVSNATLEHHAISQKSCASPSEVIETFQTAECLLRPPLSWQNVRHMRLEGCLKLKSLFSVSIATTIMLEKLIIRDCEELKHIIVNEADDNEMLNGTSIFPKLQSLEVRDCNKLEFIFPSTHSGGLQKLKSIVVYEANELKYVFGKYDSGHDHDDEDNDTYIHLPAWESLTLHGVPNMISIGINKYQLKCPSLQTTKAQNEIKEQMQCVTNEGAKEPETPLTTSAGFQYLPNFNNLKEIDIWKNKRMKTLFSISTCRNLQQLSKLEVYRCEELVNVVEDDSNDLHHINYSSVFPKLENLVIRHCNKMEFIFPFSLFGSLQKLKYMLISTSAELKYIFRKYDDGDLSNENESDGLHIHLPALETLLLIEVPKMFHNIWAKKYYLSFPSLQSITLDDPEEFKGSSFPDLMAYLQGIQLSVKTPDKELLKIIKDVQKLTKLDVRYSNIEEVLNFEGVEIEGPIMTLSLQEMRLYKLSELRHIWKGPKYILSLHNLRLLYIIACKNLRAIFSVSIVKSLPQLFFVSIEDCDELIEIIEESDEDHLQQLCFPKLESFYIKRCKKLKYLFSISSHTMLPKLERLTIAGCELEKVFIRKQGDTENMVVKDVFPLLSQLTLNELPMLLSVCDGIDFQTVRTLKVFNCPKYEEITSQLKGGPSYLDPKNQATIEDLLSVSYNNAQVVPYMVETSGSSNIAEITEETLNKIQDKDTTPASEKQKSETSATKSQLRVTPLHELEDGHRTSESTMQLQPEDLAKAKTIIEHETFDDSELEDGHATYEATFQGNVKELGQTKISIEVPHKNKIPVDDDSIDFIVREKVQESSAFNDVILTETLLADFAPTNLSAVSITTIQEEFTLDMTKKESRSGIIITDQQALAENTNSIGNIEEDTTTMKAKTFSSCIYSQAEGSHSKMSDESAQEETNRMEAKIDTFSFSSYVEGSQLGPSMMVASMEEHVKQGFQKHDLSNEEAVPIQSTNKELINQPGGSLGMLINQPRGSLGMSLEKQFVQTTKETKDTNVRDKPKAEKTKMANLLRQSNIFLETNTSLHNVIPSSHHQSQAGTGSSSSSVLEVGEILELVELKDGEEDLLAKALELYPQLRLSRGQRTSSVIAFSYRVLIDILVMLATKTPHTVTASDKLALEENLGTATFLGFEKGWIESVLNRVFGIDMFDVTMVEEEIEMLKAELETSDITLEQLRKQRVEIKEQIAGVISQFEAIDSQLCGLLEDREKSIKKMMELRGILSAQDKPFGIYYLMFGSERTEKQ